MIFKVIDNALPLHQAKEIHDVMMSDEFSWYVTPNITFKDSVVEKHLSYFIHQFYQEAVPSSQHFHIWYPWFKDILGVENIIRMKGNLYPGQRNLTEHPLHVDLDYNNMAAIYYVNNNDGYTLIDNQRIESIHNRIVIFDGQSKHASTDCTNAHARVNINFNFYSKVKQ